MCAFDFIIMLSCSLATFCLLISLYFRLSESFVCLRGGGELADGPERRGIVFRKVNILFIYFT